MKKKFLIEYDFWKIRIKVKFVKRVENNLIDSKIFIFRTFQRQLKILIELEKVLRIQLFNPVQKLYN